MDDEMRMAQVLDAAQGLCQSHGSTTAEDVAAALRLAADSCADALARLVARRDLIARPGGLFARPLRREIRLPGQSYVSDLKPSLAAMMGGR
jgi:hypothetical protein